MSVPVRRFALAALSIAGFAAACSGDDHTTVVTILIEADEACPSPEAAEKTMEARFPDSEPSIDAPADVVMLVPGTICWYPATYPTRVCEEWPSRDDVLVAKSLRTEDPDGFDVCCDEGQFLEGSWLPAPVTTQREAAAATPADCPPTQVTAGDELSELVGSDFVTARVFCNYDLHYVGNPGCTAPSGGLR